MRDYLKVTWPNGETERLADIKSIDLFDSGRASVVFGPERRVAVDVQIEDIYWFYKCGVEPKGCDYYDHGCGLAGFFKSQDDRKRFMYCGTIEEMGERYERYYR